MVLFIPKTPKLGGGFDGKLRKNPRKLAQRSHLAIEFPQAKGRVIRTFIPFLENPSISEKGKANLNSYNLVGRAGQLFSYGGAESRSLSVSFQITLAHLMEMEEELDGRFKQLFRVFFSERSAAQNAFNLANEAGSEAFRNELEDTFAGNSLGATIAAADAIEESMSNSFSEGLNVSDRIPNLESTDQDHADIHRKYYRGLIGQLTQANLSDDLQAISLGGLNDWLGLESSSDSVARVNKVLNLFIFYVNLIRGSVLNNSRNPVYGPPILRLSHGTMYNNVPCLLRSYNINIENDAGYDVQTVTPKRVTISLDLVETRAGNFGEFKAGDTFDGDNLTGWESVIETNNIDPYNGEILGGDNDDRDTLSTQARKGQLL
tara:strand:+ start:338 stop:1465 length:1128 start_codon:yes stop_codon:yes gene_type:complete